MKKITLLTLMFMFCAYSWQSEAQVCDPSSSGTNTTTLISDVTTSGGTTTNISNLSSGLSSMHYGNNFSTMSVTSYPNGSFDFSVTIESGTVGCAIWVDWDGDETFTMSEVVYNTTGYGNGPFTGTITVPGGTADGDYHMRIMIDWNDSNPDDDACALASGRGEVEDYKVTVDASTQPTCLAPSNLTASNITNNSVDIGWTVGDSETAWEYVVQAAGTGTPAGSGTATSSNPTNVGSLTANTAYEFYVRADCTGGDYSTWVGPFNFMTECDAMSAPYSQDFENAGDIPSCWSMSGSEDWNFSNIFTGNHIGNNGSIGNTSSSGGYFAWVDDSGDHNTGTTLETPFVDVSGLTTPILTFYLLSHNEGNTNVDFSVDVYDGASWNADVFTSNSNTSDWEQKTVDLSGLSITGPIKVRFIVDENNGTDFYDDVAIDDVEIKEAPTCLVPTGVTPNPTAATTATVTWTAGGTETNWTYEYGPDGFTRGTGTTGMTTMASVDLTGLTNGDDYDIYVQANCGGGNGDSDWTLAASWNQQVPPVNDTISGAIPITPSAAGTGCASAGFTLNFSTDATTDSGLDGTCNTTDTGLDQFFTWTATTDALLWNDASPGNPGIVIRDMAGNEITCANTFASDDTILSGWTIGDDLIIQIYDFGTSVSDVAFCLEEYTLPAAPNCATNPGPADGATDVPVGSTTLTWDAPASGPTPTSYDLYSGIQSDGSDLALVGNYTNPTADVTLNGFSTTIYWQVRPKNGPSSATGCPLWSLTTVAAPPVPSNDDCANAESVTALPFNTTLDAGSATNNAGFIGNCGFGMNDGVWYTFTTLDAGTVDITISGVNGWDAEVAIYSGSCGAFTCVASADGGGNGGDETLTGVAVAAGTQYWINVGHFSGSADNPEGAFTIDISTSDTTTLGLDSENIENFSLFPTIVKDNLTVNSQEVVEIITIYNLMGQQVLTRKLNLTNTSLDLTQLSSGMYIVKAKVGDKVGSYKIIKE